MSKICAIILAAGESKRMKVPKMLLDFNGETMIEKVIRNVARSEVSHILVVLGAFREELSRITERLEVPVCYNDRYKSGMLSSVQCGFRNLPDSWDAVMVFPGDQPFIEPGVINELIKAFVESKKRIVIPVYGKKRGHPILIGAEYRNSIAELPEKEGLRSLAQQNPGDVLEVETQTPGILKDFDIYEDYINEINNPRYGTKNQV